MSMIFQVIAAIIGRYGFCRFVSGAAPVLP